MNFFLLALSLSTLNAYAALDIKPGLWKLKMIMNHNGKEMNPAAEMQKMLAKLPPERRKMMEESMKKHSAAINSNGETKVCYTAEMIKNPEAMMKHNQNKDRKCESKVLSNTSTHMSSTFKCTDGTTGEANWKVQSSTSFNGRVDMKSPKHGPATISYDGVFDQADCGDVKPVLQ